MAGPAAPGEPCGAAGLASPQEMGAAAGSERDLPAWAHPLRGAGWARSETRPAPLEHLGIRGAVGGGGGGPLAWVPQEPGLAMGTRQAQAEISPRCRGGTARCPAAGQGGRKETGAAGARRREEARPRLR